LKPTNFKKPRTGDRPLRVQFRNNMVRVYTAGQLRWTDSGSDFDVVFVEFAK
jgi:hypothetical protein